MVASALLSHLEGHVTISVACKHTIPKALGRTTMSQLSRRDFLGHSAAAVGALAVGSQLAAVADSPRKLQSAADQVTLGKTGIKTSLLGMGTGSVGVRHSSNQVRLGHDKFIRLVRYAFDKGITYFDTADQYGSHIYLRYAFNRLPRD